MRQPPEAFWRATPRRFHALQKRRAHAAREAFYPTACLMAMYTAAKTGKPSKPEDFMREKREGNSEDGPGLEVYEQWRKAAKYGET